MARCVKRLVQIVPHLEQRYGGDKARAIASRAFARYGCYEIVRGFCDADDVCYANMHPKLTWERTKTLGYGFDVCDFRIGVKES